MTERDRAAVHVQFFAIEVEIADEFLRHRERYRNAVGCAGLSLMSGNQEVQSDEFC